MKLINDFFHVLDQKSQNGVFQAKLSLTADHIIYNGHFPGNPVMPGVCMVQIILELVEVIFNQRVMLSNSDSIKFLAVVNPLKQPFLDVNIQSSTEDGQIKVNASLFDGAVIFFKLKATLIFA